MLERAKRWIAEAWALLRLLRNSRQILDDFLILSAEPLVRSNRQLANIEKLAEAEFKVFSQWGDDGIIQWLVANLSINTRRFVEIGIEDYSESNTRYLLMHDNWSGLVVDADSTNIRKIQAAHYFWKHDLQAVPSFVDADNINGLLKQRGYVGDIGLLHIDIDGMDYWVWKALNVVQADFVIMEYNSVFGSERALTVPYEPKFSRTDAHFSNLYFGASLLALCDLADAKDYAFIGCNSAGNNAYFVRRELLGDRLPQVTPQEGYVESKFRESRSESGQLSYLSGEARLALIRGLPIYDTRSETLGEL